MKKRLLKALSALTACAALSIGLPACGGSSGSGNSSSVNSSSEQIHTHSLTHYPRVEATCTTDGNIEYWYCSDCGKYFSDADGNTEISLSETVIAATSHDLTHVAAVAATCTQDGNIEYWYCSDCGKYFLDANGNTEISQSEMVVAATGHHQYDSNDVCAVCGAHKPTEGLSYTYDRYEGGYSVSVGTATDTVIYIADTYDDGTNGSYPVISIGNYAFEGCTSLTSITIPDSVTSIGHNAFKGCKSLTSITIGSGVTFIGQFAFKGCTSLTSITIPDSVTSIGTYAFYGCTSLTSITIGSGVTSIVQGAFEGCTSLTSITIPDGVTSIDLYAFYGCTSLTSITIPDGVTSIGNYAFFECTSLTSITIGNGVTSIGNDAFFECTSLTSVYYAGTADGWNNISMGNSTSNPTRYGATLYYFSESEPTESGNYWHYVNGVPTVW